MRFTLQIALMLLLCMSCKSNLAIQEQVKEEVQGEVPDLASPSTESRPYFVASGTEPFWSLSISEDLITYKTPSNSIVFLHTNPILAQDSNVKRYDLETTSSKMTFQILQAECTNAMSGKVSPYKVSVNLKKETASQVEELEGCGDYKTDYRLHDIWVLETLNGKTSTKADFSKELPMLEIKAAENTFSGFAGCNRMNGTLFYEKGLLRFTDVATTRMMCVPNNKEAEFLKALQSMTTYAIENNRLTLSDPSGILTVFKKID
ncbi:META domain-containing protein [Arenibacter algicola]|uniref:META domain-containing protein n=1 Tax=Arenibacter algicola TaxID=616991 RepID=UPI001C0764DD|nr:META domain-containing protein [Arenibacter algicola]MBU2903615.1 META domain-containing protein [Arenibacter algicola]